MRDIDRAKSRLIAGNFTCVLCKDDAEYNSTLRGVKPLIDFYDSGEDFGGFSAADRVVGAGAAYLYVLLGVRTVWAAIVSEGAIEVLKSNGIDISFDSIVPAILNRSGDGFCPIEQVVKDAALATQALVSIRAKLSELMQPNQ